MPWATRSSRVWHCEPCTARRRARPLLAVQFPSALCEAPALEEQLEAALGVAQEQLGLDVAPFLCSQPVIHVGGGGHASCCYCQAARGLAAATPLRVLPPAVHVAPPVDSARHPGARLRLPSF